MSNMHTRSRVICCGLIAAIALTIAVTSVALARQLPPPDPVVATIQPFDLQDPGFEYDLSYWTQSQPPAGGAAVVGVEGAEYPVYRDRNKTVVPYSGSKMLRLGVPTPFASSHKKGTDRVSQYFIPENGELRLAFRLFSWEFRGDDHLVIDLKYADQRAFGSASLGVLQTPLTVTLRDGKRVAFTKLPIKIDVTGINGTLLDTGWMPFKVGNIPTGDNRVVELSYSLTADNGGHPTWAYFDEVNDPPVVVGDTYDTNEDTPLLVEAPGVLEGATDPEGSALSAQLVSGPAHGTLLLASNGSFSYTPAPGYSGADSFTFKAFDGSLFSNAATAQIVVHRLNDPPIARSQSFVTNENRAKPIAVSATDSNGDPLTYTITQAPLHGTLTGTAPNLVYTPEPFYNGNDSFYFVANDGQIDSNVAKIFINVDPSVYIPGTSDGALVTNEDSSLEFTLEPFDAGGSPLFYTFFSPTGHGIVIDCGPALRRYVPNTNYNGPDVITYIVSTGSATSDVRSLSVVVVPVDDAPVAAPQHVATAEDTPVAVTLAGSDIEGSPLTYTLLGEPVHGTLSGAAPHLTYTPEADFNGADSLTFKVTDAAGPGFDRRHGLDCRDPRERRARRRRSERRGG